MKDYTRRGVAYAISEILNMKKDSIYDWNTQRHYSFSNDNSIYDYTENVYIDLVEKSKNEYELYHYKTNRHIDLTIKNKEFNGFDYDSKKYFDVDVNGDDIKIYDHEFCQWFSYSAS